MEVAPAAVGHALQQVLVVVVSHPKTRCGLSAQVELAGMRAQFVHAGDAHVGQPVREQQRARDRAGGDVLRRQFAAAQPATEKEGAAARLHRQDAFARGGFVALVHRRGGYHGIHLVIVKDHRGQVLFLQQVQHVGGRLARVVQLFTLH